MFGRSNQALVFGFVWRGWQLLASPVTLFLIATYFDPRLQGYFYTFASLLAIQSFFELGFSIVILNCAAHEWAHLSRGANGEICGDNRAKERLVSLGRLVFRWYAIATLLFFIAALSVGFVLLSRESTADVSWRVQWVVLVSVVAVQFWCSPFLSILEGCGQVAQIHKFNLLQSLSTSVVLWMVIVAGGGLWASVASAAGILIWTLSLLLFRYRSFFRAFLRPPETHHISWKAEVWPMQWRLGLSGLVNYFSFAIMTPVMFYYQGAQVAGQLGMTLQIMSGIQSVALTWLKVQVPNFGALISQRNFRELDRIWFQAAWRSAATFAVSALAAVTCLAMLQRWHVQFVRRLLDMDLVALFLVSGLLMNVAQSTSAYLRAFKQEPILVMSVTCSLSIGALVVVLGRYYGAAGVAWSYFWIMGLTVVWGMRIWVRCKREWC
jgi:O-antigen/teichoic acid export membrane protein